MYFPKYIGWPKRPLWISETNKKSLDVIGLREEKGNGIFEK